VHKRRVDFENIFALCNEATKLVEDETRSISDGWSEYILTTLDVSMGLVTVLMGWQGMSHVEIAAMKAEVDDPESGKIFVALFGSAANYEGRKPVPDELPEIPSDIDGLYGILNRVREPADPEIDDHYLDRDIAYDQDVRAQEAVGLLNGSRFEGGREGLFTVLIKRFIYSENIEPYNAVIVGSPVWIATAKRSSNC
jgi:hypothetical protein